MSEKPKLGPTGDYPLGKHNEEDQGGINVGIAIDKDKLIVHFGNPTAWIGFGKEDGQIFINMLQKRINEL